MNSANQNQSFEQLLSVYLQSRQGGAELKEQHLDEDALAAFVEGTLSEREAVPVLTHLVDCGACRGISAQLARLASDFEDLPAPAQQENVKQPGQLASFWNTLTQKVFNPFDDAVVAYKDDEKTEEEKPEEAEEKSDDSQK